MAGDHDWQRVRAVGGTDCPNCLRATDCASDLGIGAGCSVRDRQERGPDVALKRRSRRIEGEIERREMTVEVRAQLFPNVVEPAVASLPAGLRWYWTAIRHEGDRGDSLFRPRCQQRTDGGLDVRVVHGLSSRSWSERQR